MLFVLPLMLAACTFGLTTHDLPPPLEVEGVPEAPAPDPVVGLPGSVYESGDVIDLSVPAAVAPATDVAPVPAASHATVEAALAIEAQVRARES